ncbi:sulfatase family protein [Aliagarivorans marinus]|uniref:sulfatase family protein n=1 Tax=Aliagarivorans marinus TaxID=561965 RepID=UPI000425BEDE|nr:sulfatase-like hydrolase/transferase [Aliagarivorans marinus]
MKKNIIILHTDQQRFDSLGCNGNQHAQTNNIDALASEGCNFTRHISTNPACMPSRASLMTGLYVPGHGVSSNGIPLWRRDNGCEDKNNVISQRLFGVDVVDRIPTLADILSDNQYNTALFGKMHLEPMLADESYGFYDSYANWDKEEAEYDEKPYYGFNTKKLILGHGEAPCGYNRGHYGRWLHKKHPELLKSVFPGEDINTKEGSIRDDIYASKLPPELHNTMWLADEVCEHLEQNKDSDQPNFIFVGYPDPHHPFTPPEELAAEFHDIPLPEFTRREDLVGQKPKAVQETMENFSADPEDLALAYRYTAASVKLIDRSVGQIVEKLKALGMYDDTIIVFTSDHGDFLGDLDMICKYDVAFNNLLHLPFIVKPAAGQQLPEQCSTPMSNADVVPTLLSMVGVDVPSYVQGIDIFGPKADGNTPMVTCYTAREANRNVSLFDANFRYTYYLDTGEEELYDHRTDLKETANLADTSDPVFKSICSDFRARLFQKHIECDIGIFNHYALW